MATNKAKKRLVILGAGFAGLHAAKRLGKALKRSELRDTYEVLLVDQHAYQTYVPLLYEVATTHETTANRIGLKEVVTMPIDKSIRKFGVTFVQSKITAIDVQHNQLQTDSGTLIEYDQLLLAPGSQVNFFNIPGLEEQAYPLKTLIHALRLREQLVLTHGDETLVRPKIIIGGGGSTGVELAGELAVWFKALKCPVEIIIIEGAPTVLASFDARVISAVTKRLESLGVTLRLGARIQEVQPQKLILTDGETVSFDVLAWTGGTKQPELFDELPFNRDEKQRVLVDCDMQCRPILTKPVFAVGDAVCVLNPKTHTVVPGVARAAISQADVAAHNMLELALVAEGSKQEPALKQYEPWEYPYVIPIGGKFAVSKLGSLVIIGFWGWVLKILVEINYLLSVMHPWRAVRLWLKGVFLFIKNERLG